MLSLKNINCSNKSISRINSIVYKRKVFVNQMYIESNAINTKQALIVVIIALVIGYIIGK